MIPILNPYKIAGPRPSIQDGLAWLVAAVAYFMATFFDGWPQLLLPADVRQFGSLDSFGLYESFV